MMGRKYIKDKITLVLSPFTLTLSGMSLIMFFLHQLFIMMCKAFTIPKYKSHYWW